MKKKTTVKSVDAENLEKITSVIHGMFNHVDDEMDRMELKKFVRDDNLPRFSMLNEDDNIGVEQVLVIGGYLAMNKLHNELHNITNAGLEDKLQAVFNGEIELEAIAPENMPDEILEALGGMIDVIRDIKKGKK